MGPGELQFLLEAVRKAEAVDESEQHREQDAPPKIDADDVLERHVDDRQRDHRLDERREPRARWREIERRADQRERMRDRETGDDRQELAHAAQRNHQAKQEEQVVEAVEDVRDAEPGEPAAARTHVGLSATVPERLVMTMARSSPVGGR